VKRAYLARQFRNCCRVLTASTSTGASRVDHWLRQKPQHGSFITALTIQRRTSSPEENRQSLARLARVVTRLRRDIFQSIKNILSAANFSGVPLVIVRRILTGAFCPMPQVGTDVADVAADIRSVEATPSAALTLGQRFADCRLRLRERLSLYALAPKVATGSTRK